MKKILSLSLLMYGVFLGYSQNTNLTHHFKIEGFIEKIGVGYELPLNDKLLLDINAGIGGANIIEPNYIGYKLAKSNGISYSGVFFKGQLRYYISRQNRLLKNRSLSNNAGSFIGLQSKFNLNTKEIGQALLTDVHFGQQLPLGKKIIFRYHIGLGYANNFKLNYNSLYPAVNIVFGYIL